MELALKTREVKICKFPYEVTRTYATSIKLNQSDK